MDEMKNINTDDSIVIGFDMDGVIIDHTKNKIALAKQLGFNLLPEQTPSEFMRKVLPLQEMQKLQSILFDDRQLAMKPPLMAGAKSTLISVKKLGIPYFLISRRKNPELAIELLKKHKLWPKYFNENNSYFVDKPEDKDFHAARLGITHFVDDELEIINKLISVKNRFLFDQFNMHKNADFYKRIVSWLELEKHLS